MKKKLAAFLIALARRLWPSSILELEEVTRLTGEVNSAKQELVTAVASLQARADNLAGELAEEKVAAGKAITKMREECDRLKSVFDQEKEAAAQALRKAQADIKTISESLLRKDEELRTLLRRLPEIKF